MVAVVRTAFRRNYPIRSYAVHEFSSFATVSSQNIESARFMQFNLDTLPFLAKFTHALFYLGIRVDDEKCPWAVGPGAYRERRPSQLSEPVVDFLFMTPFATCVVVIDYSATSPNQLANFLKGICLQNSLQPLRSS